MKSEPEDEVKIVIFGAAAAGKKNFIRRYCDGLFSDFYDPNLAVSGERRLANISGRLIAINLERIPSNILTNAAELERITLEADAVIFLYDGSSSSGTQEIRRVYDEFLKERISAHLPKVVIIAKADAAGDAWQENLKAGREFAREIEARFCVSSALWGDGVKDSVEELVAEILGMGEHSNVGLAHA